MKRINYRKLLTVVSASVVIAVTSCPLALAAPDVDLDNLFPVTKDETVYIKTNQSGKATSIVVSDQLTGTGVAKKLNDSSSLSDIENVKGEEDYKKKGDQLTWENKGEDIVYQGKSDRELPVSFTVTYELDGKEISPEKLAGKSGHIQVRYDYHNDSSLTGGRFTPFLTVTGLVLDMNHFKNVKLSSNGHYESDGQRKLVIGYSIPGLLDYLGIDESEAALSDRVSLSDSFSYEADVSDYEAPTGSTIVTSEIFSQLDGGDAMSSTDDLESSLNKLADASSQLVSGSSVLASGVEKLQSGSGTLSDGVKQLAGGGNDLASGAKELASGAGQLNEGIAQAGAGAQTLTGGIALIHENAGKLAAGAKQIQDGLLGLENGAGDLAGGLTKTGTQVSQLKGAVSAVLASPDSQLSNADRAMLESVEGGLDSLSSELSSGGLLGGGAAALKSGASDLKQKAADPVAGGLQQLAGATGSGSDIAKGAAGLAQALSAKGAIGSGAAALKNGSKSLNDGANQLSSGLNALNSKVPTLTSGIDQLASGADKLAEGMAQFDSEGIRKLVDYMGGDLGTLLKKANEMTANAKAYNNYSGIADDMTGTVKFIFIQN